MLLELSLGYLVVIGSLSALLHYIEQKQWWTLRLKISCFLPWRTLTSLSTAAIAYLLVFLRDSANLGSAGSAILIAVGAASLTVIFLRFLLPLAESRAYVRLRWRAWAGSSRTGIPSHLSKYIGDVEDWRSMDSACRERSTTHPVERFLALSSPRTPGITHDPTTLLNARQTADEQADTIWIPRSDIKQSVYAPTNDNNTTTTSVSLLWGSHLGFRPRVSRGIISVPLRYLSFNPTLVSGQDARPICLAHGILARNKGLQPHTLVCNLEAKNTFREFEENSVLWPRPAKTLRSFYRDEMSHTYSRLGPTYVCAATELALLIADTPYGVLTDWLEGTMEQQDLSLNNLVAELGATVEDLDVLYRGHYAAMLVSLSLHRMGVRCRPDLLVFIRLWEVEGRGAVPGWMTNPAVQDRREMEAEVVARRGVALIEAII